MAGGCLDLPALDQDGSSLAIGGNVTRVAAEGLRFCKEAFQVTSGGAADVVFLVDNSGSMWSQRAFANGKDTLYLNDGPCGIGTTGGSLVHPILDDKALPPATRRTVALLQSDPGTSCEFAGDPYNSRFFVVRNAVDFLARKSPQSTVGVLGFAAATMREQPPLRLDSPERVAQVKSRMVPDSAFGTNYGIALDSARKWLADSLLAPHPRKAIVLISDGRPGWGFDLVKDSTRIPVFGIFLGKKPTPDTAVLKGLSDKTGGCSSGSIRPGAETWLA